MNFLAHHWLAGGDEDMQLGAWLGDFIKGRKQMDRYSEAVQRGIRLHRTIDSWTDQHEITLSLKAGFPAEYRRYAGIVLDLMTDHFLARDWRLHDQRALPEVEQSAYQLLDHHAALLPHTLKRFIAYARPRNLLSGYQERAVIVESLAGISRRLSRSNPLGDTVEFIDEYYARWEPGLIKLLPQSRVVQANFA